MQGRFAGSVRHNVSFICALSSRERAKGARRRPLCNPGSRRKSALRGRFFLAGAKPPTLPSVYSGRRVRFAYPPYKKHHSAHTPPIKKPPASRGFDLLGKSYCLCSRLGSRFSSVVFHCFFVVLFSSLSFLLYSRFLSGCFFVMLFGSLSFLFSSRFLLSGFLVVLFRSLSFLLYGFFMRFFVMRFCSRRFSRCSSGGSGCSSSRSRCSSVISSERSSRQTHSGGNNQR